MTPLLFSRGRVFDGRHYLGTTDVLVQDGRISAIGERDDLLRACHTRPEEVDLAGGLLAPGFHDAHMHPVLGGLERLRCELNRLDTRAEYLATLAGSLEQQAGHDWFRGGGWSVDAFGPHGPTAEELDSVVRDQPAFLPSSDHHNAWVNTRALELCGITASTPDPPDGWIERDAAGNPTGTLREAAAALVFDHVTTSREEYHRALLEAQEHLFGLGITGWHDALLGGYAGLDDPTQAYLDGLGEGSLRARVRGSLWWDRHRGTEQVPELVARRQDLAAQGFDAGSVKLMADGIAETFTATLTEGYDAGTGCPCGDHGLPFLDARSFQEAAVALDAAGFQLHVHAIGDKAVHDALDAIEQARRTNGMNDHRHHIAHLQLVRPEDRRRFRQLGVVANVEGMWASEDTPAVRLLEPHLDDERMSWHYPFADIVAAGAVAAGGSDWPVNPAEPVSALHVLVNRASYTPDQPGRPLVLQQRLSLADALAAYTSGAAYVDHRPWVGTVQVGSAADLVLLDRDPFAGRDDEIGATSVAATYLGGERVAG